MDTPYRVEYDRGTRNPTFHIVHTGAGKLCRTDDPVFAHKLVDLLNDDLRRARTSHQPSSDGFRDQPS